MQIAPQNKKFDAGWLRFEGGRPDASFGLAASGAAWFSPLEAGVVVLM